jgi:hypothetical protein
MKIRSRVDDIEQQLKDAVRIADAFQHVAGEAELADHEERLTELELEAARLSAKYGAGSERALAATERLESHKARLPALQLDLARSRRPAPESSVRGMVVYGQVIDENNRGLAGLRVVAAGEKTDVAVSRTGADGSFQMIVPGAFVAVRLRVVSKDKRNLHLDEQPIEGSAGEIAYWEAVIPAAKTAPAREPGKARKRTYKT